MFFKNQGGFSIWVKVYLEKFPNKTKLCAQLFRSSHQRCFIIKGVLRNFAKFTGKHLCQSLFLNKVAGLGPY